MTQKLGAGDVRKIAALSRLELTPAEIELFSKQLGDILAYADEIQQIDTTGVAPTSHALAAGPDWRDDEPVASLDRRTVLEAAADASTATGLFKVPKVL